MLTIPAHSFPTRTPIELFALARRGLADAAAAKSDEERYAVAHLAALRAAAALVAARARRGPNGGRSQMSSIWGLLTFVAPSMSDWSAQFAAGARRRAQAEAGLPGSISADEADACLADATRFVTVIAEALAFGSLAPLPPAARAYPTTPTSE